MKMADNRDSSFFQTIKEKVDLEDYLIKYLNVELVPSGAGMMAALCPFHEEDTPSFYLYDQGEHPWKTWRCYGACQEGGTVLDAVIKGEDVVTDVFEAAEYLNDLYDLGLEANSEGYKRFKKTIEETRAATEKAREEMADSGSSVAKQARQYLHNRGYTDETINYFELGVDLSTTKSGRLSIPIYDKMGQPVSAANRALYDAFPCRVCHQDVTSKEMVKRRHQEITAKKKGIDPPFEEWQACPHCGAPGKEAKVSWLTAQNPKYLFMKDFDKARYLYHENGARGPLLKDPEGETLGLFLVEGYADAWAGWQSGHKSFCAYSGAVLSEEQAKSCIDLAQKSGKPIILVPDFDDTGQGKLVSGSGVGANIRKLHAVDPTIEVQVIHGIDKLTYERNGETKKCKDLGEVLQYHGEETVREVLRDNRWPAGEWQIRQVIETVNPKTGGTFFSKEKEMQLIGEVLRSIQTKESLDHLIDELSDHWNIRKEQVRNFFYSNLSAEEQVSAKHLFKDIEQALHESELFLADTNIVSLGFDEIDDCFPGGGVRPGQLMMLLGKSGTGKTMLASQMLANMADRDINCLFFSLEQGAGSFFPRLASQALDRKPAEVEELIKTQSSELDKVQEIFRNMVIVDNVPTETQEAVEMTPGRMQSMIQEANLTHFEGKPVDVVIVDHLGIMEPGPNAPRGTDETSAPGYIMKELFKVCKATRVFMIVLQQLPKMVPFGVPFSYDAGWGGSAQTNFCDYIIQIWRPEQQEGLEESELLQVEGQYKIALGKNRFGRSALVTYFFDKSTLRILPPLKVPQPTIDNDDILNEGLDELEAAGDAARNAEVGATVEGLMILDETTPSSVPNDTQALLDALGAAEENSEEVDPHEDDPFGSAGLDDTFDIS